MMTFENIDISDPPQQQFKRSPHQKLIRIRIKNKEEEE